MLDPRLLRRASARLLPLTGAALLALATPAPARAACEPGATLLVDGLGTPADELARLADLLPGELLPESGMIRRGSLSRRTVCAGAPGTPWDARYAAPGPEGESGGPRVTWVPLRTLTAFHNLSPGGANDGLLWQGKGLSSMLSGGAELRWGPLSAQLAPAVAWAQNQAFPLYPTGQAGDLAYAGFYGDRLDLPQRMGSGAFTRASFGQSHVELQAYGLALGVSSENRWWGPGVRNALLISNNADGIPHAYLQTTRPADIGIGKLEAVFLVGSISRTRWYAGSHTDKAYTAVAFTYEPSFAPGLYLGAGRTYVESWSILRSDHGLSALQPPGDYGTNVPGNNQLLTLWMRWVMPESHFETYLEWGRDDSGTFAGLMRTGDATSAFTLGFQKLVPAGERWWRIQGEFTQTRDALPFSRNVFYSHPESAGYTNGGQLIGAAIGPGADSQYLGVDVLGPGGRLGGYVERIRRNDEFFLGTIVPAQPSRIAQRDVELVAMLRQVVFAGPVEVSWEAGGGYRWNRSFLRNEPVLRAQVALAVPFGGAGRSAPVAPTTPAPSSPTPEAPTPSTP
jgi:hypothetical protein